MVYKIFVNIYLTLIKFSGINFRGFEPARILIPHEINQLYGNLMLALYRVRCTQHRVLIGIRPIIISNAGFFILTK